MGAATELLGSTEIGPVIQGLTPGRSKPDHIDAALDVAFKGLR